MGRPKTPTAAWIKTERQRLGWKSEELAARLAVSDSTVRGWESGRSVSEGNLDALERLFDRQAPGKESGEATGDLAAALTDLADAIRGQTLLLAGLAEVQAQQSVQVGVNSARIDSLAAVLERLIERDAQAAPTPEAQRETRG